MEYTYTGDAHRELLASYRADEEPFPTRTSMNFPRRDCGREEVDVLEVLFFPRCWSADRLVRDEAAVLERLDELGSLMYETIRPYADLGATNGADPVEAVATVLDDLPTIRERLKKDVEAAYKGDPAAKSYVEIVRSYPGVHAVLVQRVAHALYEAGAPGYARELTEYAKSRTGIDIHPGADLGEYFFVDHGTGVVVGETVSVGDWVRLYQNVTLGALHFEKEEDEEHMLKKGYKRHPDLGDHVVVGAGSNVLGAVEVGDHVSIGANSWITDDVPAYTTVYVSDHPEQERKNTG
jgi:serine O-acetyltransferase